MRWLCPKTTCVCSQKAKKGQGKAWVEMVDKLQNYYGISIRSNNEDLLAMKKAIFAALCLCAFSEDDRCHFYCPDGANSWCGY